MIGQTISHYTILEKIGQGGMGVVYKAEDTKLKRIVALKFLPPELTRDPEAKKRFIREAQAAAALDHPYLCTVHEIDEADDRIFIAMAFVPGQSLKERIIDGPFEIDSTLSEAYVSLAAVATFYEWDRQKAKENFQKAYEERDSNLTYITIPIPFESIVSDPRYENLLRRMGLTHLLSPRPG